MTAQVHIHPTPLQLAHAVAHRWAELARAAIDARGRFSVALAGGRTPRLLYELLASLPWRDHLPWTQTELYLGDERCVPPDHVDSNARMVRKTLLDRLPHPPLFFPLVSDPHHPEKDAVRYATLLRQRLGDTATPCFDLILLGMGADGHFASLFPNSAALEDKHALVIPVKEEHNGHRRLSLGLRVIVAARQRIVMVTGTDKHAALAEALHQPTSPLPIARLQRQALLEWHVDQAAYGKR